MQALVAAFLSGPDEHQQFLYALSHRQKLRGQRGDLLLRPAGIFGSVDEPDEVAAGHVQVLRRISGVGDAAKEAYGRLLYRQEYCIHCLQLEAPLCVCIDARSALTKSCPHEACK